MQDAAMVYPPITPAWTNLAAVTITDSSKKQGYFCMSPADHRSDSASPSVDRLSPRSASSGSSSPSISPSKMPPKKRYAHVTIDDSPLPENIEHPTSSSQDNAKKYRRERCPYVSIVERSHSRKHIKLDQLLTCLECPFVTKYRHQLETHALTHAKTQPPFKCRECDYSAASKRALNGHLKSHSRLLPYRCCECKFASKSGHRLELHLKKFRHEEGFVLSGDGSFDPKNVITSSRREAATKKAVRPMLVDSSPVVPIEDDVVLPFTFDTTLTGHPDFADDQIVPEIREFSEQTTPVDYSRRSPSPRCEKIESPIDLSGRTSAPLDFSETEMPKNEAQEWRAKLGCLMQDTRDENLLNEEEMQQQIRDLHASLAGMREYLWTLQHDVLH